MPKTWKLKTEIPLEDSQRLSGYPKLFRQLLFNRGLTDQAQAAEFLSPQYEKLHSPFLFKDMQKAADRIWQAIEAGEKICIYGDYDADAVTASAVLNQAFRQLGYKNVESYIPDRFAEGYGVNMEALAKIKDLGAKLIITVDCGTNSVDAAEWSKDSGVDLIITDHHEIVGPTPQAYALVNPKNPDEQYPYREITGVGVAFKTAQAILMHPKSRVRPGWEKWLLDLVAIGTVADCHSLMGENRILVKYGLQVLSKTKWPGLRALMQTAGADPAKKLPDTYTLGFVLAPRLNAAGRLEHAGVALDALLEADYPKALEKAARLEAINQRRQQLTASVVSEAKEQVVRIQERKILALMGDNWPKGVVGLVAGRLAEEYYKPVIVLERTESLCTGSARTAGEFDILQAIKYSERHVVKFGGHKQAAGLTVKVEEFENFYSKLLEYADGNWDEGKAQKVLRLEAELEEADLSPETCGFLGQMEPFGVGNPQPRFLVRGLKILGIRPVGATGQHSQFHLQKGGRKIAGIAFNFAGLEKNLKVGDTVDAAAELIEDGWNGRNDVKLRVVDMRAGIN